MADRYNSEVWAKSVGETVASYRRLIDSTLEQLTDAELHARPAPEFNSVAIILRHLGGNLKSRWTDFLVTDGEKQDRNRDAEFLEWDGSREALMQHFNAGWESLNTAIDTIDKVSADTLIEIRGEPHTLAQAFTRSITHVSYHVGQIVMVARMVHDGPWKWLTIRPGTSEAHNTSTWGTAASRSVFGEEGEE